ncbi:MAG: hypothetical protein HXY39_20920 [Chloroflexi bacterium]|nr:hypothetical protein [Chloroflexota bacterium]
MYECGTSKKVHTMAIGRNKIRQLADAMTIQWANGKNEARLTPGSGRFVSHVGWYAEVGRDDEFDTFMQRASVPQMEIRHPRQGAPAQIVRHWNLGERLRLFPVTSGPVAATVAASLAQRNIGATIEAGIGMRWGRGEGERSKMAIRGYLQLAHGDTGSEWLLYPRVVQISVRSRMTDELLAALIDHVRVCEVADTLVDRAKHPDVIQCYELALPLGPGKEEQWGKGETTTVLPLASQHPERIDLAYLRGIWRPDHVVDLALHDWPDIQAWAQEFNAGGYTEGAGSGAPGDELHPADDPAATNGRPVYASDTV